MRVMGMISGTSADAIEVVVCDISGAPPRLGLTVLAARSEPIPIELQRRIHAAATVEGSDVEAICLLDAEIGRGVRASGARDGRRHGPAPAGHRPHRLPRADPVARRPR